MIISEEAAGGGTQFAVAQVFGRTGNLRRKVRVRCSFYTGGTITSWQVTQTSPTGTHVGLLLSGTDTTFSVNGDSYFELFNDETTTDQPWTLGFTTVGMSAAGSFVIDWDVVTS